VSDVRTKAQLSGLELAQTPHISRSRFHIVSSKPSVRQSSSTRRASDSKERHFRLLSETTDDATIAFDLGFAPHEAFSRRFAADSAKSPTKYRIEGVAPNFLHSSRRSGLEEKAGEQYLSGTRAIQLAATAVVFRLYTRPYKTVMTDAFDQLVQWTP